MAGLSSPGIGSGLQVDSIVSKLMQVESQPLNLLNSRETTYQAQLAAYGTVSSGLSTFQSALSGLTTPDKFQQLNAAVGDTSIFSASASSKATPGNYSVAVTQLAQAQTLRTSGVANLSSPIGGGSATTISFQFGTTAGGTYAMSGTKLAAGIATTGISPGSLSINGTLINTGVATNSAKALASAINAKTATTGVTATAAATVTAALGNFTDINTGVGDSATVSVGGIKIADVGDSATFTAADLDAALADNTPTGAGGKLAAAGITFTGTAAGGDLAFQRADGANIDILQTLNGGATGGFDSLTSGVTSTTTSSISLTADSGISVAGSDPTKAGLSIGSGLLVGAAFTQDSNQATGTVTIDATNNSLQGIRDAINKAKLGVTASIVSDGSSTPYHLVLTSNKTGVNSSMKVSVTGEAALDSLLGFDATSQAGQKMTQSTAAQDAQMSVNGIFVTSSTNVISEAIQGVSITAAKVGITTLNITRDTSTITKGVSDFVKAYNELTNNLKQLTAYDSAKKTGGTLVGDATVRAIQVGLRRTLTNAIPELADNSIKSLTDIGLGFQKDGTLALNTSKLSTAIANNPDQIAGLFASLGTSSDSLVSVAGSTAATKAGKYAVSISTPASKGSVTGTVDLSVGTTTIDPSSSMSVTLDGTTATVSLVAGTYTASQLASMIQSAINGTSAFTVKGSAVKTTVDGNGHLAITSERYGSTSKTGVASGNNLDITTLFGAAPTVVDGADVAGTIGGMPATGSGQFLTAAAGSSADGLKLKIDDNATGGTVDFSQGYAYQLNSLVTSYTQSSGLLTSKTKGINSSIADIGKQRDKLNLRLADIEKRYRAQYTALDTAISQMNQTSTYLTQQLASLAKQTSSG